MDYAVAGEVQGPHYIALQDWNTCGSRIIIFIDFTMPSEATLHSGLQEGSGIKVKPSTTHSSLGKIHVHQVYVVGVAMQSQ